MKKSRRGSGLVFQSEMDKKSKGLMEALCFFIYSVGDPPSALSTSDSFRPLI
ncbi:hypothetical protein SAMN06265361_103187 [Laceyella tengchongensis]|uniref:Uncharacterized protein n=1 Tax=Laceyella tengchongensis TaxID=574699 RepID=A0AA45WNI3_9BACL|nr:hypothetical protein SAMN06265361_103187 [Laceyella tengchongensis]